MDVKKIKEYLIKEFKVDLNKSNYLSKDRYDKIINDFYKYLEDWNVFCQSYECFNWIVEVLDKQRKKGFKEKAAFIDYLKYCIINNDDNWRMNTTDFIRSFEVIFDLMITSKELNIKAKCLRFFYNKEIQIILTSSLEYCSGRFINFLLSAYKSITDTKSIFSDRYVYHAFNASYIPPTRSRKFNSDVRVLLRSLMLKKGAKKLSIKNYPKQPINSEFYSTLKDLIFEFNKNYSPEYYNFDYRCYKRCEHVEDIYEFEGIIFCLKCLWWCYRVNFIREREKFEQALNKLLKKAFEIKSIIDDVEIQEEGRKIRIRN